MKSYKSPIKSKKQWLEDRSHELFVALMENDRSIPFQDLIDEWHKELEWIQTEIKNSERE